VRADALPQPERYFSQWSANAAGLFVPTASSTPLYGGALSWLSERVTVGLGGFEVFLGYPILLTALLGLCWQRRAIDWIAFGIALVFFVLCLGPTLKIFSTDTGIWLPYAGLKQLPLFEQNRCPVRFVVIGHFFLLFASARGVEAVVQRVAARGHARAASGLVLLLAAWTLLEGYSPPPREHKPYTPPLATLAKLVPGPVVHTTLPSRACNEMLLQVFHGQPIANGCLARPTQEQQAFVQSLRFRMANDWAGYARLLEQAGFKNIIVDRRYPPEVMAALQTLPFNVVVMR
jgi:hypothetical protein